LLGAWSIQLVSCACLWRYLGIGSGFLMRLGTRA
jgi:hypothetical protein